MLCLRGIFSSTESALFRLGALLGFIRMQRLFLILVSLCLALSCPAADKTFNFADMAVNSFPTGFVSWVTGTGAPGEWKIVEESLDTSPTAPRGNGPKYTRVVLGQLSNNPIDEHFPLLVYDGISFTDFTLTTKFKTVKGTLEQMAGIAFRIQNPSNYYVIRASSLGNNVRFYKVVNGDRSPPLGPEVPVPTGIWQELKLEVKANTIRFFLNEKDIFPLMTDNTFREGKIGFWTKSDSVSYFSDTQIHYTPRVIFAQLLVNDLLKQNPRLLGVKIFAINPKTSAPLQIVASTSAADIGIKGEEPERQVIEKNAMYYGKGKDVCEVTIPLHDRNGETVAALRLRMKPFPGQTEQNALARSLPIRAEIEGRIPSAVDLFE
ncbi:MAG: hypothetical protein JWN25_1471 [Verrucomicrobiales bacterium]|nr:hypothetical protein [Verrucomicrobiales bacterium]